MSNTEFIGYLVVFCIPLLGSIIALVTGVVNSTPIVNKSNETIAKEVIAGKWGNGAERKNRLTQAGYNYSEIQALVNQLLRK